MFRSLYQSKRVLVTGHTGFKGSWLCIWLKELGAKVAGYALDPPSNPNNFDACRLSGHIDHHYGDIRDIEHLISIFRDFQPEIVFHLAAQALVRSSYEDPKTTFEINCGGTVNVLEAVRRTPSVRAMVNVTSDKCYENREWVWGYRENDPMGGHDPYSASKGCAELIFASYLRSFFNKSDGGKQKIGAASCRAGNAIGGGDWGLDRLIPDCVRALHAGQPVGIRNPNSVRPWQYVLELLSGYLWLGACLLEEPEKFSGGWNFGPLGSNDKSVQDVVERFINIWGNGMWKDLSTPKAVHEAAALRLCCDKAVSKGWGNTLSLSQAIVLTADWYKKYYDNFGESDMYNACVEQIRRYTDQAKSLKRAWATEF